jgi:nucleotidyltransferase substrate binding protein (TIGR01987 family)
MMGSTAAERCMPADVRWEQRFSNYCRALEQLETFFQPPELNEREEQGLIKAFESTFELAWNTLRDLLSSEGVADLIGSRDTLRTAFRVGLVEDGSAWMAMIQARNLTSHTYNRATAQDIGAHVRERYLHCFQHLRRMLEQHLATAPQP